MKLQQPPIGKGLGIIWLKFNNPGVVIFGILQPMRLIIQYRSIEITFDEFGIEGYCLFIILLRLIYLPTVMEQSPSVIIGFAVCWVELEGEVVVLLRLIESVGVVVDDAPIQPSVDVIWVDGNGFRIILFGLAQFAQFAVLEASLEETFRVVWVFLDFGGELGEFVLVGVVVIVLLVVLIPSSIQKIADALPDALYKLIALLVELRDGHEQMLFVLKLVVVPEHLGEDAHLSADDFGVGAGIELVPDLCDFGPEPQADPDFVEAFHIPGERHPHLHNDGFDLLGHVLERHADVVVGLLEDRVVEVVDVQPGRGLARRRGAVPVQRFASLVEPADERRGAALRVDAYTVARAVVQVAGGPRDHCDINNKRKHNTGRRQKFWNRIVFRGKMGSEKGRNKETKDRLTCLKFKIIRNLLQIYTVDLQSVLYKVVMFMSAYNLLNLFSLFIFHSFFKYVQQHLMATCKQIILMQSPISQP